MFRLLRQLILAIMIGAAAALIAGLLGFVHPFFDTIANFRLHLAVGLVALALIWSIRCSRAPAVAFGLAGLLGIAASASGLALFPSPIRPAAGEKVYRLIAFNLRYDNPRPDLAMAMIRRNDPDILALSEISTAWQRRLKPLEAQYRFVEHCPEWSNIGGVMILSKLPMTATPGYCHDYAALALKEVVIGGRIVEIGAAHLRWPWPASGPRQIEALKPRLGALGEDALIAGDFNSATWTYSVAKFARYGGLELVSGIGPTWIYNALPTGWARFAGLPIDNVMARGAVRIVRAATLAPAGSDHLPMLVEFVVRDRNASN